MNARRRCLYGCTPDARSRAHLLSILFRRSEERFERRLSESASPAVKRPGRTHERPTEPCHFNAYYGGIEMTASNDTAPTLSATLESTLALTVDRINRELENAPDITSAAPEDLAPLVDLAAQLSAKLDYLKHLAHCDQIRERAEQRDSATADDFNGPIAADQYEHFLSLLVVAGGRDRMKALRVRKAEGVAAAISFLEECPITGEADHGEPAENADDAHDTPESAAYRRGHRHGLHQATLAIEDAVNALHPNGADQ